MTEYVPLPGHPTAAGAGYDCQCGACLAAAAAAEAAERRRQEYEQLTPHARAVLASLFDTLAEVEEYGGEDYARREGHLRAAIRAVLRDLGVKDAMEADIAGTLASAGEGAAQLNTDPSEHAQERSQS